MGNGTRDAWLRSGKVWGSILAAAGMVLIPWMIVLAGQLPGTARVSHWSLVWLGLDTLMAAGLLVTGGLLLRGDERFRLVAAPTAALFLVDAWFDTMTAEAGRQRLLSVTLAVFFELPMAALCVWLAFRAARRTIAEPDPRMPGEQLEA